MLVHVEILGGIQDVHVFDNKLKMNLHNFKFTANLIRKI